MSADVVEGAYDFYSSSFNYDTFAKTRFSIHYFPGCQKQTFYYNREKWHEKVFKPWDS